MSKSCEMAQWSRNRESRFCRLAEWSHHFALPIFKLILNILLTEKRFQVLERCQTLLRKSWRGPTRRWTHQTRKENLLARHRLPRPVGHSFLTCLMLHLLLQTVPDCVLGKKVKMSNKETDNQVEKWKDIGGPSSSASPAGKCMFVLQCYRTLSKSSYSCCSQKWQWRAGHGESTIKQQSGSEHDEQRWKISWPAVAVLSR